VLAGGDTPLVAVPLAIHIINDHGDTMLDRTDTIAAASFAGPRRAADDRIGLSVDHLPPGDYLLTIDTTLGKTTARRDVRFSAK
jgi:hypothetical protein